MPIVRASGTAGPRVRRAPGLLALCLALALSQQSFAQPKSSLPDDLAWVPGDAAAFVRLLPAAIWTSDAARDHRALFALAAPELVPALERSLGLNVAQLERLTLLFPTIASLQNAFPPPHPEVISAVLMVTLSAPFDRDKVIRSMTPEGRAKSFQGKKYYFDETRWCALLPVSEQTFLFGSEGAIVEVIERQGRAGSGPLQKPLQDAAGKAHLVAGVNGVLLNKHFAKGAGPGVGAIGGLFRAESGTLTVALEKDLRLDVRLDFADEDGARQGAEGLKAAQEMGRVALTKAIEAIRQELAARDRDPATLVMQGYGLGLLRQLQVVLKALPIEIKGPTVQVPLRFDGNYAGLAFAGAALVPLLGTNANKTFSSVGETIGGSRGVPIVNPQVEKQLKQLAGALDSHHKAHGSYPPAALYSKQGEALLSWRVALLPHLGEDALYKQFKLDEPWDSHHNKKLLTRMPRAYAPRYAVSGGWKTPFQVFAGPGTLFEGKLGLRRADITDAAGETVLIAELFPEVAWSKPADMAYAAKQPLPRVLRAFGLHVLFADGSVRALASSTPETTFHALITRAGGEKVVLPDLKAKQR